MVGRRSTVRYRDKVQQIYRAIEADNARAVKPVIEAAQSILNEQVRGETASAEGSERNQLGG